MIFRILEDQFAQKAKETKAADRRVMEVSGQAKTDIDRARHTGVLLGFMIGAAALVGAAAAWFAACAGGRHRENGEQQQGAESKKCNLHQFYNLRLCASAAAVANPVPYGRMAYKLERYRSSF